MNTIKIVRKDHELRIVLNRPSVRNALDDEMIGELNHAISLVDDQVRVVVLSGEGDVFCSGADLNWMRRAVDFSGPENERDANQLASLFFALESVPCPVVGQIHGAAMGGAVGFTALCDVAVCAAGTRFALSEVRLGLIPAVISPFLIRRMGLAWTRRWALTGQVFDAAEALACGLVHQVVPGESLDVSVQLIVDAIVQAGPQAVRRTKRLLRDVASVSLEQGVRLAVPEIAAARVGAEGQSGLRAFLEKRKPTW